MEIQQQEREQKGSFFIEENQEKLAEITYTLQPGILVIDHTEVDDKLRGKNVGYMLVNRTAEYAREKSIKIKPVCPFAKAVLEKKTDEYRDVLWMNEK